MKNNYYFIDNKHYRPKGRPTIEKGEVPTKEEGKVVPVDNVLQCCADNLARLLVQHLRRHPGIHFPEENLLYIATSLKQFCLPEENLFLGTGHELNRYACLFLGTSFSYLRIFLEFWKYYQ